MSIKFSTVKLYHKNILYFSSGAIWEEIEVSLWFWPVEIEIQVSISV